MNPLKRVWNRRENWEAYCTKHPIRSALPFLTLSAAVLGTAVLVSSCRLCYAVRTDGRSVAYVDSPITYAAAVAQAESEASEVLEEDYSFEKNTFSIEPSVAFKKDVEDAPEVADSLMETIPELESVYTLSIDGVRVGQAEDRDTLEQAMEKVKNDYVTGDTRTIRVENQVELKREHLKAEEGVTDEETIVAALQERVLYTTLYTVREGDTVEGIMEKFSVNQEWLQAQNPDINLTLYQPTEKELGSLLYDEGTHLEAGLVLRVQYFTPRLVVTTLSDETSQRETVPERQVQSDDTMYAGEERMIEDGTAGEETVLARVERRCGKAIASDDLEVQVIREATPMVVAVGSKDTPGLPADCSFIWPVRGPISSDFGYRFIFGENNFHRGVDIAAASGTTICAACGGTVEFVGERGTYGNLVIINHHNGFYTYYGHCSAFLAEAGDVVQQGQAVALVGSTGRSTGPHCHFEVRYNGSPIDPLLYLTGSNGGRMRDQLKPIQATPLTSTNGIESQTVDPDPSESKLELESVESATTPVTETEKAVDAITGASCDPLEEPQTAPEEPESTESTESTPSESTESTESVDTITGATADPLS